MFDNIVDSWSLRIKNKSYFKSCDYISILDDLKIQSSQRLLTIGQALRLDIPVKEINEITKYDNWFISQLKSIVEIERLLENNNLSKELLLLAKQNGFTDKLNRVNRGVKQAGFVVLHQTYMPSVLIETGFITKNRCGYPISNHKFYGYLEIPKCIENVLPFQ